MVSASTPASAQRAMMGSSRRGATRSSPSKGVTRMPEMPVSAARSCGEV
jgi:hypothetical protein